MHTKIDGVFGTEIYTIEDGQIVIEQACNAVVRLVPDELLTVIRTLQAHYDDRARWQEPTRG